MRTHTNASRTGIDKMIAAAAGIPYKVGSFWTAGQRQGHSLHEVSYRACFKPQLAEYFISRLTNEGDVVLDPFMGRGTTVLEAALNNRAAYGSDVNPLSEMLASPRLSPPALSDVSDRLRRIPATARIPAECEDLLVFFHEKTLRHILAVRKWFAARMENEDFDGVDDWIRMVVINRLTGHSSGFLSVRTMPPNQAVSVKQQREINRKNNQVPAAKDLMEIVMRKSKSLVRSGYPPAGLSCKLGCCSADALDYVGDGEVDLVLTSPPFLDVVNYAKDNWLRGWFAGIDIDRIRMDIHKNVEEWCSFVSRAFGEFARAVKRGGHVAFEVGDVKKGEIMLDQWVVKAIQPLPFKVTEVVVNRQGFTKTANCWGISNNRQGTLTNRIVIAERM